MYRAIVFRESIGLVIEGPDTAEEMLSGGSMTPDEIIEKLEQRVGPEGRKLFEQFLRKVNKLHAQQYLEAQERTVENRGGDRGR
jgi:hypothetical protein